MFGIMTGAAEARTDVVLDLIGLIYDAVADASRWQLFLEALARAIGASKASLCLRELHGPSFAGVCWSGLFLSGTAN